MDSGLLFAIISPFLSSISTIFKSEATKALGPFTVLSFGSLLGASILIIFILLRKHKVILKNFRDNFKDLFLLVITRGLLGELLFTLGLSLTLGVKAIFFTKAEPYFVLLWNWILKKEPIKLNHLILLAIHISGAVLLSTGGKFEVIQGAQIGDLLIILAMGLFALSYFPASRVSIKLGASQTNILMLLVSGLFFLPFAFLFSNSQIFNFNKSWIYLFVYVVLFTTVGLTFWFASLKTVKGWIVSAFRSIGPLAGLPFAYLFFGEKLNNLQLLGGAIVITTSFLIAKEHFHSGNKR